MMNCAYSLPCFLLCSSQAGCELDESIIPRLVHHLTAAQQDIRAAAAAALADAVQQHPAATASALSAVLELFGEDLEEQDEAAAAVLWDDADRRAREAAQASLSASRLGVAAGLEALAKVLEPAHVRQALDFLVNKGLGEPTDVVREAMVGAGEPLQQTSQQATGRTGLCAVAVQQQMNNRGLWRPFSCC